ncbi:MAG: hypothetical protein JSS27_13140 [Planctomycetes bacterium]|nr:hypothetical protein [Planctomycetota bacterium]
MTCKSKLKVVNSDIIGQIVGCPKCGGMVQIAPPAGWQPGSSAAASDSQSQLASASSSGIITGAAAAGAVTTPFDDLAWSDSPAANAARNAAAPKQPARPAPEKTSSKPPASAPTSVAAAKIAPAASNAPPLPDLLQAAPSRSSLAWLPWVLIPVAGILSAAVAAWVTSGNAANTEVAVAVTPASVVPAVVTTTTTPTVLVPQPAAITAPAPTAPVVPNNVFSAPAAQQKDGGGQRADSAPAVPAMPPVPVAPKPAAEPVQVAAVTNPAPAAMPAVPAAAPVAEPEKPVLPKIDPPSALDTLQPRSAVHVRPADTIPPVNIQESLLHKVPGIKFNKSLARFANMIGLTNAVPVTFDLDALAEAGVTLRDPVTIDAKNVTLTEVLACALGPRGLIAVEHGGQLLVTTDVRHKNLATARDYDISDLAGSDPATVVKLVTTLVEPTSWAAQGGEGVANVTGGKLNIRHTAEMQAAVTGFLDRLRVARHLSIKNTVAKPPRNVSRSTAARQKLDGAVTINFSNSAPLGQVLSKLEEVAEVQLPADGVALAAAGRFAGSQATVAVSDRPLRDALDQALNPLGLAWRAFDETTVQITSQQVVDQHGELEVYSAAPYIKAGVQPAALIERLRNEVSPTRWQSAGGAGALVYDEPSQSLFVWQSQPVQRQVEAWLVNPATK